MCVCLLLCFQYRLFTFTKIEDQWNYWRTQEPQGADGRSVTHTHMQTRDPFGRNTDTLDRLEPGGSPGTDSQGQAGAAAPRVWRNLPSRSHPQVFCSCSKTRRYYREYIYMNKMGACFVVSLFVYKGTMQFRIVKFLKYAAWIFHRLSLASLKAPSNVHFFCLFIKNIFLNEM